MKIKHHCKRVWKFLWDDDSIWSWLANIVVAFLVIRFLLYPVLGLLLGTSFPIVAVVSESMEHGVHEGKLCNTNQKEFKESFENYWEHCGGWYEQRGVTMLQFSQYPFRDGFNKGDVIILWRAKHLNTGDILVFDGGRAQPIIHRVVKVYEENGEEFYQTKGDHNSNSITDGLGEEKVGKERIYGKGLLRIPYLGWLKIIFVDAVRPLGINIQR